MMILFLLLTECVVAQASNARRDVCRFNETGQHAGCLCELKSTLVQCIDHYNGVDFSFGYVTVNYGVDRKNNVSYVGGGSNGCYSDTNSTTGYVPSSSDFASVCSKVLGFCNPGANTTCCALPNCFSCKVFEMNCMLRVVSPIITASLTESESTSIQLPTSTDIQISLKTTTTKSMTSDSNEATSTTTKTKTTLMDTSLDIGITTVTDTETESSTSARDTVSTDEYSTMLSDVTFTTSSLIDTRTSEEMVETSATTESTTSNTFETIVVIMVENKSNVVGIIGGSLGGGVLIITIVVLIALFLNRRHRQNDEQVNDNGMSTTQSAVSSESVYGRVDFNGPSVTL